MKKNLFYFFSVAFACTAATAFAQKEVSVNMQTGTANVVIPISTVTRGAVQVPVNLVYSTNGVRVTDVENNAGMGWQVVAGGQIIRQRRGLPDDVRKDNQNNARLGWLYNANSSKIFGFTVANNSDPSNCADETTDVNYINANFGDLSDTEPDLFSVNAPGLSCQFVFDNDHVIRTIPYQDLKITYTTDAGTGLITSFTVVNDLGVKYVFAVVESVSRSASTANASNINFLKTDYNQFKNGINYNGTWYLQTMTDASNNGLTFTYAPGLSQNTSTPINLVMGGTGGTTTSLSEYTIAETHAPQVVSQISSTRDDRGTPWLTFLYTSSDNSLIQHIRGNGRDILFTYDGESIYDATDKTYSARSYLKSIAQGVCEAPMNYQFKYIGLLSTSNITSTQLDYWGFYAAKQTATSLIPALYVNPGNAALPRYGLQASTAAGADYTVALSGTVRSVDPASVMRGALNQITYAKGGSTTITYEPNDYIDVPSGTVVQGGGLRVSAVTDYDGLNSANNMTRTYTYINPATGKSSGKPLSLPVYALTMPYSGSGSTQDQWNASTVRSETDLSAEDESIVYSHVRVTQAGAGSVLYEYTTPGTYWDAATGDWAPTVDHIARTNCNVAPGFTRNGIYAYPFAPNINYDFERGLLTKTSSFNDSNQEVSETAFSYQRVPPLVINALKIDDNMSDKAYAKYFLYSSCTELLSQKTTKLFDSPTLTQALTSAVSYTYGGAQHKLPTKVTTTNSDGSIKTTGLTYTRDYVIPSTTDPALLAIQQLQALNINEPVEKQYTVQRNGVAKTTGAELTLYNAFNTSGGTLYLPAQQRRFTAVDGVTDFQPAASGTGALTSDSRYVPVANFLAYDYSGALLSADDNNRHVQSVVTDQYFGLPVAQLSNVKAGEFAYNDFDSKTTVAGFTVPAGSVSSGGRTGQNAAWLNAGVAVSVPLSKNAVAKNYIFSCWIVPSGAGNATLNLTSGSTTQSYNLPIAAAGSWKYYELKIPVTAVSGSMTLSFQSNVNIGIDDILVYPDVATVSTVAYDPVWQTKTAETNGNGVSTYYSYDGMGRLQYVYDQDKNIVMKKAYVQLADETNFVMPSFDLSPVFSLYLNDHYPGHVISFTNTSTPNACLVNNNISYSWDFGDGSAAAAGTNASHAYAATGTYTVTLTATSASYGQRTTTQQVRIGTPPALIPVNFLNDFDNSTVSMTATFSQPGYSVTFSSSDLTSGTAKIIPDRYNVSVHLTGPQGTVDSFRYTGESGAKCFPNTSGAASSTFGLTDDLTFKSLVTLQITAGGCNVH